MVTYVFCPLSGFSFIGLLRQHRILLGFLFILFCVSISCTLRILFPLRLRQYLAHLQNSFLVYFYVSILRTLRIRLYWIVLLISHTLRTPFHSILTLLFHPFYLLSFIGLLRFKRFLFNGLLCKYLAHVQNSLSIDCNVCIQHTCRILFHWIITLAPCTHLGLSFVDWLR